MGSVARIFTGAPVPAGADAIVMQEDCEVLDDGRVRLGAKPVAVLLILLLLTASAPGALCVGALVGYGAARLLPARAGH